MKKAKVKSVGSFFIAVLFSISFLSVSALATSPSDVNTHQKVYFNGTDITVNPEEEISRAIAGISDPVQNAPVIDISASFEELAATGDFTVSKYVTTREIQIPVINSREKIYATTGVAVLSNEKTETDSKVQNYVTAYATLYWQDNPGIVNNFLGASGGWDVDRDPTTGKTATLSNRTVNLEWYYDASHRGDKDFFFSTNTFNISKSSFNFSAFSFAVNTSVKLSTSTLPLKLSVLTSFF